METVWSREGFQERCRFGLCSPARVTVELQLRVIHELINLWWSHFVPILRSSCVVSCSVLKLSSLGRRASGGTVLSSISNLNCSTHFKCWLSRPHVAPLISHNYCMCHAGATFDSYLKMHQATDLQNADILKCC